MLNITALTGLDVDTRRQANLFEEVFSAAEILPVSWSNSLNRNVTKLPGPHARHGMKGKMTRQALL